MRCMSPPPSTHTPHHQFQVHVPGWTETSNSPTPTAACRGDWPSLGQILVLLAWPSIPVRQPCAWVMFWDRRVDICVLLAPMQGQLSSWEGGWETNSNNLAPGSADKSPASVVFHSSDGPWWKWNEKRDVWETGQALGCGRGPTGQSPPNKLAYPKRPIETFKLSFQTL